MAGCRRSSMWSPTEEEKYGVGRCCLIPSPAPRLSAAAGPRGLRVGGGLPPPGRRCLSAGAAMVSPPRPRRWKRGMVEGAALPPALPVGCGRQLAGESGQRLCCPPLPAEPGVAQCACVCFDLGYFSEFFRGEAARGQTKVDFRGPRSGPDCTNNQKTSRLALNLLKRASPFSLRFNLWFVVILFIWSLGQGDGSVRCH